MFPSLTTLSGDFFAEFEAIQRQMRQLFGLPEGAAGNNGFAFPAVNVGTTDEAVEVYAFAPGLDPAGLEVSIEKDLLVISGERAAETHSQSGTAYARERFTGAFKRVLSLPEDVDASRIEATYRNGVLKVLIPKVAPRRLRKIEVKALEHKH